MTQVYWINGWLFLEDAPGTGRVYFPDGEPTLGIAACFGRNGDYFATKQAALDYFRSHSLATEK